MDIAREIQAQLPKELRELIRAAGEVAADLGESLYLVGGAVRDLLLRRDNLDVDLVLEGDAPSLARRLARQNMAKVVTHPRFGTATFSSGAVTLDLATARSETYAQPGALPRVKPGKIEDDLFRRDFTVNAMAANLHPACFGELVDPYGGKNDLDLGIVRVLHPLSFQDDPTRIWRAIRYEQRLEFKLDAETERLARRDLEFMDRVSGDRLRHELERILREDEPERALRRAGELGALARLSKDLEGDAWLVTKFQAARRLPADSGEKDAVYLPLLAWRLAEVQLVAFLERLRFGGEAAAALRDIPSMRTNLAALEAEKLLPSDICRLLQRHRLATVMAAVVAADSGIVRDRLTLYLSSLRFVTPSLNGDDLKRMGVPPGRKMGSLLRALRDAKLDGGVTSREMEERFVRHWIAESKR